MFKQCIKNETPATKSKVVHKTPRNSKLKDQVMIRLNTIGRYCEQLSRPYCDGHLQLDAMVVTQASDMHSFRHQTSTNIINIVYTLVLNALVFNRLFGHFIAI